MDSYDCFKLAIGNKVALVKSLVSLRKGHNSSHLNLDKHHNIGWRVVRRYVKDATVVESH